jgi:hypothetical protein
MKNAEDEVASEGGREASRLLAMHPPKEMNCKSREHKVW